MDAIVTELISFKEPVAVDSMLRSFTFICRHSVGMQRDARFWWPGKQAGLMPHKYNHILACWALLKDCSSYYSLVLKT